MEMKQQILNKIKSEWEKKELKVVNSIANPSKIRQINTNKRNFTFQIAEIGLKSIGFPSQLPSPMLRTGAFVTKL